MKNYCTVNLLSTLLLLLSLSLFSCNQEKPQPTPKPSTLATSATLRTNVPLPSSAEQGAMLHAHTWRFRDIESEMANIAAAGFNSVQVSPINKTKRSTPWWILYQPCDLKIGNMVLGTEAEFRSMCQVAEQHGVKIIVDVVLNHVANNDTPSAWANELDPALKRSEFYHWQGGINNYQNRFELTQKDLLGLPDWNTQRSDVQQLHIEFLNLCIDAGADGFRFDAAKHMETSGGEDQGQGWAGNYWENVLGNLKNRNSLYLFGEVLPDLADNEQKYLEYYDITAHGYGTVLRNAVRTNNVTNIQNIPHGGVNLPASRSLVYVENHDDFHGNQDNAPQLSYWQRKMGYAIAAARAEVTPRLFDRPGNENLWKDADIATINRFHNAMVGQNEYLRFPRQQTLVVDRGTKGTAIINLGDGFTINTPTNLEDGTYGSFTVSNGQLSGQVPGGGIVTLYNGSTTGGGGNGGGNGGGGSTTTTIIVHYDVGFGNSLSIRGNTNPLNWGSGLQMTNVNADTWRWTTTDIPQGQTFEFKPLINDQRWATNSNWQATGGQTIDIYPNF